MAALAAPPGNKFVSQEMVSSFDLSQAATRPLSFPDSNQQTPLGSHELAVGLTLETTLTPTTLRQLPRSIANLESQEEAAVLCELLDID